MRGGSLEDGAFGGCQPAVTLFDRETRKRHILPFKHAELTPQVLHIYIRIQGPEPLLIKMQLAMQPPATLAHHQQTDIQKLSPVDTRHVTYHRILI